MSELTLSGTLHSSHLDLLQHPYGTDNYDSFVIIEPVQGRRLLHWWQQSDGDNVALMSIRHPFVNSMNHIVIKRQLFADSIKRRLLFSVSSCCFFIKWLSSRNNTADWYCQEQPNAWSLWTGKHSPILLVFESPINQMAHLQIYENCKLSQAGKELGKKKNGSHRLFHFNERIICKRHFSPHPPWILLPPDLLMLSFNICDSMLSFRKSKSIWPTQK